MKKWLKRLNSTPFGVKPTEALSRCPAGIKPNGFITCTHGLGGPCYGWGTHGLRNA